DRLWTDNCAPTTRRWEKPSDRRMYILRSGCSSPRKHVPGGRRLGAEIVMVQGDFLILGPLAVTFGGLDIDLGGMRQRTILAVLLLHEGKVLPIDRLIDAVWRDRPPSTARNQIKTAVFTLREIFRSAGIGTVITTRSQGYVIEGLGSALDLNRFNTL